MTGPYFVRRKARRRSSPRPTRYGYGNFGCFSNPDGNKVELWKPNAARGTA